MVMSREDPQLRIRLPFELKEKIQKEAISNNCSMNAVIVSILERSFIDSKEDKLDKLTTDIEKLLEIFDKNDRNKMNTNPFNIFKNDKAK